MKAKNTWMLPFYMSHDEMCESECENCAKIFGIPRQEDDRHTPLSSVEIGFSESISNSSTSERNFDAIDSDKSSDCLDHLSTASDIDITWNNIFDDCLEIGKEEICNIKHYDISKSDLNSFDDDSTLFDCFACDERFIIYKEMINHLESVHQKNDQICCKICNRWINYHLIEPHFKTCQASKPYQCAYCLKYFETYEHKENHQADHNKKCPFCESIFFFQTDYSNHVRNMHHKVVIEGFINCIDGKLKEDTMETSLYNIKDRFKELLTSLLNESEGSTSEDENSEEWRNQTSKDLKQQSKKVVHVQLPTIRKILKSIQKSCPDCHRPFTTHKHLGQHCKTVHHSSHPYECYSCNVRFTSANQRTYHLNTQHNSIYKILCKHCNKYLKTEYKMSRHIIECSKRLRQTKIRNAGNSKMSSKNSFANVKGTNKDGTHFYLNVRKIIPRRSRTGTVKNKSEDYSVRFVYGRKKPKKMNKSDPSQSELTDSHNIPSSLNETVDERQRKRTVIDSEEQVNDMEQVKNPSPSEIETANKSCGVIFKEQTEKSVITEQNSVKEQANVSEKSPKLPLPYLVNNQKKNVSCSLCSKSFRSSYDMLEHLNEAHKKIETIVCKLCGVTVSSDINIVNHLVECLSTHLKEDEKNVCDNRECPLCDRYFNNYSDLLEHVKSSHGTYVCYTCDARFYTTQKRREHLIEKHDGLTKIMCKLCRRQKSSETKIREHWDTCKDKPYQCRYCYARFFNSSFYLAHSEQHKRTGFQLSEVHTSPTYSMEDSKESTSGENHISENTEILRKILSKVPPPPINCNEASERNLQEDTADHCAYCCEVLENRTALLEHCKNMHSTPFPYICYTCDQQFESPRNRLCHIKQKHYMHIGFVCKMCGTIEKKQHGIKQHMLLCAKKPLHCECCSFRFHTQVELDQHHDDVAKKPYRCQCCPSRFAARDELIIHNFIHLRPLKEVIDEFVLKEEPTEVLGGVANSDDLSSLEHHLDINSQQIEMEIQENHEAAPQETIEKDHCTSHHYVCYTCEEKFEDSISRLTHILQKHYMPNGFVCKMCSVIKEKEHEIKDHMLTCAAKPLQCKCCPFRFCTQAELTEHQNEVATKPYLCQYCPCRFVKEVELKIHEVVHANPLEQLKNVSNVEEPISHNLSIGKDNIDMNNSEIGDRRQENNGGGTRNINELPQEKLRLSRTKWCPDCYKRFYKYKTLQLHCEKKHNNSTLFGCHCCSTRFSKEGDQTRHLMTAHRTGKYPCKFCNIQLIAAQLLEHMMRCRNQSPQQRKLRKVSNPATIKIFSCTYCREKFKSWYSLDLHEVVDHGKNSKKEKTVACRLNDGGNDNSFSIQEEGLERVDTIADPANTESDGAHDVGDDVMMDVDTIDMPLLNNKCSEVDQQAQDLFTDTRSPTDVNISSKATRDSLEGIRFGYKEWVVILHDFLKSSISEDSNNDDSHNMNVDVSNIQLPNNIPQPSISKTIDDTAEVGKSTKAARNNPDDGSDYDLQYDATPTNMESDSDDSQLPLSYIKEKTTERAFTSNSEGFGNSNYRACDKTNTDTPLDVNPLNFVNTPNFEFKSFEQLEKGFMNEEPIVENEKLEFNVLVSNIIARLQDETDGIDDNNMDVEILPAALTDKDRNDSDYNMISDPLFIEGDNTSFSVEATVPKKKRTLPDQYLDQCWVVLRDFVKRGYLTGDESSDDD